jgi:hypothetical protein
MGVISTMTKFVIQFVAVATAAPFVRIGKLLISAIVSLCFASEVGRDSQLTGGIEPGYAKHTDCE